MLEAARALCERSSTEGKWLQNHFGSDLKCSRAIWDRSQIEARVIPKSIPMAPWSTKNCFQEHPKQQVGPSWPTSGNRLDALTAIGAFWAVFLEILGFMPQGIMLCIPGLHAEERGSTFSIWVPLCKIWANIGKYSFGQTLQIF